MDIIKMDIIKIIQCIFLGIVQGFTEPLPISSSGHLLIIKNLFNFNMLNDVNFEIIANFGSFIAITFLYRKKILEILKDFYSYTKYKKKQALINYNYFWTIIIGTIPAGIFGLVLKEKIDLISNNVKLVGIALLITAFSLFLIKNSNGKKEKIDLSKKDALCVGLFQTIALLPGISRSGTTIFGSMLLGFKKSTAVDYSFMLYLPISAATMVLGIKDLIHVPNITSLLLPYTLGMIASMIITYFSAKWFIDIVKRGKLEYFSIYCIIAGLITIIFL